MEKEINKVLVVTGANKGVGYSIIDGLLREKNQEYIILLCSRLIENGNEALKNLNKKHGDLTKNIKVVQLDITDSESVENFIDTIKKNYNSKITCLVNNAGIAFKGDEFDTKVFDVTFGTNFYSTVNLTKKLLENNLIVNKGKIIFIGSSAGKPSRMIKNKLIREKFLSKDLTEKTIMELASQFRSAVESETVDQEGWPHNIYSTSKICINKYAYVLGHSKEVLEKEIQVYTCCPGWVQTDMGGKDAYRTLEEGSKTPVYLVNLKYELNKEYQGQFFYDEKIEEI